MAQPGAKNPRLDLVVKTRKTVETAGARIGLAETTLVFDVVGAYRAEATYHLFNTTEQFLAIQLPDGARLWTARVAGQPVKPVEMPAAKGTAKATVHVPLVKTADGDLDYEVVLYYGGKASPVSAVGGTVGFPLLRTANVQVARSQVRLFVPKTHRWFDFGGTMHRQEDEDDLKAEIAAYKGEELERLRRTMRHGDKYAQVLASGNVGSWTPEMYVVDGMYESSPNEKLRTQLENNAALLAEAEAEQGKLAIASERQDTYDNRGRLDDFYESQKNIRSFSAVKDAGGNWTNSNDVAGANKVTTSGRTSFNPGWFDYNGLNVQLDPAKGDAPPQQSNGPVQLQGATLNAAGGTLTVQAAQPAAPEIAQGQTKAILVQGGKDRLDLQTSRSESDKKHDALRRYQEEVATANAAANATDSREASTLGLNDGTPSGSRRADDPFGSSRGARRDESGAPVEGLSAAGDAVPQGGRGPRQSHAAAAGTGRVEGALSRVPFHHGAGRRRDYRPGRLAGLARQPDPFGLRAGGAGRGGVHHTSNTPRPVGTAVEPLRLCGNDPARSVVTGRRHPPVGRSGGDNLGSRPADPQFARQRPNRAARDGRSGGGVAVRS